MKNVTEKLAFFTVVIICFHSKLYYGHDLGVVTIKAWDSELVNRFNGHIQLVIIIHPSAIAN
jgi:hypothetical protein